ncbi:MAG: hypothetical protein CTY34_07785 [Methylobacter sp.]|nr:MAG: hypothetical protein CTY34_07785 [Methylobacter sp.]PPD23588.1 MAG: hypothetical protein CTY24_03765 [Methylobacter sp.]
MSNEENTTNVETPGNTENAAKNKIGEIIAGAMKLKESNPKVFFGAIGGVVLLIIIAAMSGGDKKPALPKAMAKNIVVGQKYVIKSANSYDPSSTVRLVAVPGTIAAYDDSEEDELKSACKHLPQGTPVIAKASQDAYGKKDAQIQVQILEGECKDFEGWVLSIDLQ